MKEKQFFVADDVNLVVPFLEEKKLLPKNAEKKYKIEKYMDGNGSAIVALVYKKHSLIKDNMVSSFEIDYNYDVYKNVNGERVLCERTIYFPHFRENKLENKSSSLS